VRLSTKGTHHSVVGPVGEARPFVNKAAWDGLLVGTGGNGAHRAGGARCLSGTCRSDGTCQ
jgi:hypothetical protein